MRKLGVSVAIITLAGLTAATPARAAQTTLDDFESANSPSPWVFSNGPEFPGAKGSLTSGSGHTGKGAHLAYDFSGGGHYVAAQLTLSAPANAAAIGFWAKVPPGIHAELRVTDSQQQTFQYDPRRPLDAVDPNAWFQQVVELDASSSHWGGPNDGVLHLPIRAVALLAADPLESGAAGAMDFDEVFALDSLGVSVDPAKLPLVPAPANDADLASRLGVNIHFVKDDQALDIAHNAGFSIVRMDLGWSYIEKTKGVYDFSGLDGLIASLAARNMRLHLILDYFNSLYPAPSDPQYATVTVPAFAAVSQAAAAHFAGKNLSYEIWNEPNGAGFWPPTPSPTQFATLCKAAIAAVHTGDPSAKVSTAGLAGFDFPFLRGYLGTGGATGADAIGIHPYRQTGGESITDELVFMRSIVASALPTKPPVWDTEWGYTSTWYGSGTDATARATQAKFVVRELLSAWAVAFPLIVYYDIRDDGTDPANSENNFGLIQNDYADKPAMVAVRTLTSVAAGRSFVGFIDLSPSSLHAMRFDGTNDTVLALWSDAAGSAVPVTTTAVSGVNMLGAPIKVSGLVVHESDGPIYLTFAHAPIIDDGGVGDAGGTSDAASPDGGTTTLPGSGGCGCSAAGTTTTTQALWLTCLVAALGFVRRKLGRTSPHQ